MVANCETPRKGRSVKTPPLASFPVYGDLHLGKGGAGERPSDSVLLDGAQAICHLRSSPVFRSGAGEQLRRTCGVPVDLVTAEIESLAVGLRCGQAHEEGGDRCN